MTDESPNNTLREQEVPMPEEAAIVYEIIVYDPAIQGELIGALERVLKLSE